MIVIQQTDFASRESLAIIDECIRRDVPFRYSEYGSGVKSNEIAVGSVEFVEMALGKNFKPDYHPNWLPEFVKRKTFVSQDWPESDCLVKPNDRYKTFDLVHSSERPKESLNCSEFFCQERVETGNEWRIYINKGEIVCVGWYHGPDEDSVIPEQILLDIQKKIPYEWSGTVDMMETENGVELCECHHPYSIGWYGESEHNGIYFDFIIDGYERLKS